MANNAPCGGAMVPVASRMSYFNNTVTIVPTR